MNKLTEILVFEPDMLFSSRIENVAEKMSADIAIVTDIEELLRQLAKKTPQLLLVNLDALNGDLERLGKVSSWKISDSWLLLSRR